MKSNRWLAAPLCAFLLTSASRAFAQPAPLNAPMIAPPPTPRAMAPLDAANWRAIHVKNVRPSLIAFQLDSVNNKFPAFLNMPPMPGANPRAELPQKAPDEKRAKGPFDLADGMRLAASDEQNLLFVAGGNAQQIARLQELVDVLDQPLRLVEIEAQLVELPTADIEKFGIASDAATAGADEVNKPVAGAFQIGFVRKDFQKRLDEMVEAGTTKVVSTTPLTLTNNTGQAVSLRSGPIDNTGANQNKLPTAPAQGSDVIITLTPTINGDDTITVLMGLETLPKTAERSGLLTVANVRDGDTIALADLKSPFLLGDKTNYKVPLIGDIPLISGLFRSKTLQENERTVLVFVTARIVRTDEN